MAVWNTDVKQNTTIADRSGGFALEFMANRTGAMETDYRPVEVGSPYRFVARMKTSLNGANDTVEVTARWYNHAKALIGAPVAVFASAVLPGAGNWYDLAAVLNAPAAAAFATVRIEKDDVTTPYIAYCDFAEVTFHPVGFRSTLTGVHNIANGAYTTIQFDNEAFDYGSIFNVGTFTFTAPADGIYTSVANLGLSVATVSLAAGAYILTRFLAGGTPYPFDSETGATDVQIAGTSSWNMSGSITIPLTIGQTAVVQLNHSNAAANIIVAATSAFSVIRVE